MGSESISVMVLYDRGCGVSRGFGKMMPGDSRMGVLVEMVSRVMTREELGFGVRWIDIGLKAV